MGPKRAAEELFEVLGLEVPSDLDDDKAREIHAAMENLGAACDGDDEGDEDMEEDGESEPMDKKKPKGGGLLVTFGEGKK